MYKQYCLHRPQEVTVDAFYLAPIQNPKGIIWYKNLAIGVNTLTTIYCKTPMWEGWSKWV